MSFRYKTYKELLDALIANVRGNSVLTDINVGSIIRTILSAAALEDAEQYVQIAKLVVVFNLENAEGDDLDRRLLDYGDDQKRRTPTKSTGTLQFGDSNVTAKIATTASGSYGIGITDLTVADYSAFPASGYVILDRDVAGKRERLAYTKGALNHLTLSPATSYAHASGATVILSQQGVDHPIGSGTACFIPATSTVEELDFITSADVVLLDGEVSVSVAATSKGTGAVQNAGSGLINQFVSKSWGTATVTNPASFGGGNDLETDAQARERVRKWVQSLSRGTASSQEKAALDVVLSTGQSVASAQLLEPVTKGDPSYLYIEDGSGSFVPTSTNFNTGVTVETGEVANGLLMLIKNAVSGERRSTLGYFPCVRTSLNLYKSTARGTYASYVGASHTFNVNETYTVNQFTGGYYIVDSNGRFYSIVSNTTNAIVINAITSANAPPASGSYAIIKIPTVTPTVGSTALVQDTDYTFNETTGDVELTTGLSQYDCLVACAPTSITPAFTYYTGLIAEVQKVINGVKTDLVNYPGWRAAGTKTVVLAPITDLISVSVNITTDPHVEENTVAPSVSAAIQTYVNGLGIGESVTAGGLIAACMAVASVTDVLLITPTGTLTTLPGHLPRTLANLITVS